MSHIKDVYSDEKCEEVTTYVSTKEKAKDPSNTEKYYDLVTDFFERGWGKSFHFAPQKKGEKREDVMLRHQFKIADVLKLQPGMKVLDVGCGIAGPMKNIAEKSGANIVGLNINSYQIEKAKKYIQQHGLEDICTFHQGNFMKVDLPDQSFDAIYAIEATVHAPDRTKCFQEIYRLLKPGCCFAGYEYVLLDHYDEKNPEHVQAIEDLEHGGNLQKTLKIKELKRSFLDAGFKILEMKNDCQEGASWALPLSAGFARSKIGRILSDLSIRVLEFLRIAPKGSSHVGDFLNLGADAFVKADKLKIFTPNFYFLVQKPK